MSKRRVERGLEDLEAEVLEELAPDVRLQLFLEAAADEKEEWLGRLRETAPVNTYNATERAYTERGEWALRLLSHAIYELHTTSLQYALLEHVQMTSWLLDHHRGETPTDEELEAAEERARTLRAVFANLYLDYHGYRRFASEVLGVDLETWFKLHPEGSLVLDRVEEDLEDDIMTDLAEQFLRDDLSLEGSDEESSLLEELVESRYQSMVATWEEAVPRIDN